MADISCNKSGDDDSEDVTDDTDDDITWHTPTLINTSFVPFNLGFTPSEAFLYIRTFKTSSSNCRDSFLTAIKS